MAWNLQGIAAVLGLIGTAFNGYLLLRIKTAILESEKRTAADTEAKYVRKETELEHVNTLREHVGLVRIQL